MRWLLDEMLPAATAEELNRRTYDAVTVHHVGLAGADDPTVFDYAISEDRIVVTENFADFATLLDQRLRRDDPCVPVVFVRKADFPRRGALAARLADRLDAWSRANPHPYIGPHWP